MKIGVVSLGGKSSQMILEEARKYFDVADGLDIRNIEVHASPDGLVVMYNKKQVKGYDCLYVRGSYKYSVLQRSVTRALHQETYMPVKPTAYTIAHNKFLTLLELQKNHITIPKTYLAATTEAAKKLLEEVTYPVILKIPNGTQGKGVMVADSVAGARSILDALEAFKQPYIIQEYVETEATDIRAIVVGEKVVAAMKRLARREEVRANIHAGGVGKPVELAEETKEIAVRSARAIGAEICAVDILEGLKPAVIEVKLSPGLVGITKALKKNVSGIIAEYLSDRCKEFKAGSGVQEMERKKKKAGEYYIALDVRNGIIKLPRFASELSGFMMDDEVAISVGKGKVEILEKKVKKEE